MKNILVLILTLFCFQAKSQNESLLPPEEDRQTLVYPLDATFIYIGNKNPYEFICIYEGKKGHDDILYLMYDDYLEKVPLPEIFEKKRIKFAYKTDISLFFCLEKNTKKEMAFHIREKRWMSVPKLQGHDGEDELH
jgi:hypothetical protein